MVPAVLLASPKDGIRCCDCIGWWEIAWEDIALKDSCILKGYFLELGGFKQIICIR